ncbi:TlpA family protein disulfide reductase [Dactylosporangium matsuzakiense]|uniref:Thiol reductase thioredoxin n=1 Tax=Dactylosporangium matsuzakiense TaxID=53360 RepID=A0A9W6KMG6_9ACTN|nr:thioredoxin family protein [Dactylosporangium matsuzakiense]GLL02961.1 thiol reductase thioredoxin [Dactylosporangium matsuzakiense]
MTYVVLAVLAAATVAGLVYRARYGRLRVSGGDLPPGLLPDGPPAGVTLLHFTSATCAPCRQVRAVCADLAKDVSGVLHVEVDADEHLDAVKGLDIWRLPTLLVVDRGGRIARRTVGVPDRADLRRTVTEVLAA